MTDLGLWLTADEYLRGRVPELPEYDDDQPSRAEAAMDERDPRSRSSA